MDNVLRPNLIWIDGSCFRKMSIAEDEKEEEDEGGRDPRYEEMNDEDEDEMMEDESRFSVEYLSQNRYKAVMRIPSGFYGFIIGKKGVTKKKLESELKVRITLPARGTVGSSEVVVHGETKASIISTCRRLEIIVADARSKLDFTHFISIPLNSPEMQEKFVDFKRDVLRECSGTRGLDETVFQSPKLLHLTFGTLALMDPDERQIAINLLKDCKETIILPVLQGKPFQVKVSGLEIMNDDPSEVDVIYAKIDCPQLQRIADEIVDAFRKTGFLNSRNYERVKLHLTLINTVFRKEIDFEEKGDQRRETLDSRPIFAKFGDCHFGEFTLNEIHLSQRRTTGRHSSDYYSPSYVISLSSS